MTLLKFLIVLAAALIPLATVRAQNRAHEATLPVSTQWTLDAAGTTQRAAIKAVMLLVCPSTMMKGTGFYLKSGIVVTNDHVVKGCKADEVQGFSSTGARIQFNRLATDPDIDLAALHPLGALSDGLELGDDHNPEVGVAVSTWGFPLIYNGPAPLLSVGYVAGYSDDHANGKTIKHLVINGAFNPGNSGGPLFRVADSKVIGIVVAKFHLYPPFVKQAIDVLSKNSSGVTFTGTDGQGKPMQYVESQVVALILEQYYNLTQVMIGEAISVSELRSFLQTAQNRLK